MYTNTSCTLYVKSNNYQKVFIPHCFFSRDKKSMFDNRGFNYLQSAFVCFKLKNIAFTDGQDLVVEGECDITVDTSSQQKISEGLNALKGAGALTVMTASVLAYGSGSMRHIELSCK